MFITIFSDSNAVMAHQESLEFLFILYTNHLLALNDEGKIIHPKIFYSIHQNTVRDQKNVVNAKDL